MLQFKVLNLILVTVFAFNACVTPNEQAEQAPEITSNMPLDAAVDAAVKFGGNTYKQAMQLIERRHSFAAANAEVKKRIIAGIESSKSSEMMNTVRMYRDTAKQLDRKVFISLIFSELNLSRQLGWQLAAMLPSVQTGKMIDDALSLILAEGKENEHYIPQMAQAVAANELGSAYKVLERGLMQTGNDAFAKAMIVINPSAASADFLNYLAIAPIEDLRQISQKSVNLMTCYVILNHMHSIHPPVDHPRYEHLFYYSVSRNQGLAELARAVLEDGYGQNKAQLAFTLARLPAWIQVAFVEGVRRNLNANVRGFLAELRKLTVQDDVLEELKNISL